MDAGREKKGPLYSCAFVQEATTRVLLSNCSEYRPNSSTNVQRCLYSRKRVCRILDFLKSPCLFSTRRTLDRPLRDLKNCLTYSTLTFMRSACRKSSCICTVENLFAVQYGARTQNCHSPSFSDKFIDYSTWIINNNNFFLVVLVCSVTVYFCSLFVF